MMSRLFFFTFLTLTVLTGSAHAKVFRNQYVQFELPAGWDCKIEGTEWVCQSNDPQVKKEVIVICAAKQRGPDDDLQKYEEHLKKGRSKTDLSGKPYTSEVSFVKTVEIKGTTWVDGMHYGSEIPGFYTRYLSTIKGKVAMLLTWSVAKSSYEKYRTELMTFVNSLEALESDGSAVASGSGFDLAHPLGDDPSVPSAAGVPGGAADALKKKLDSKSLIGLAVVIGALGAYIYIRKRKKK